MVAPRAIRLNPPPPAPGDQLELWARHRRAERANESAADVACVRAFWGCLGTPMPSNTSFCGARQPSVMPCRAGACSERARDSKTKMVSNHDRGPEGAARRAAGVRRRRMSGHHSSRKSTFESRCMDAAAWHGSLDRARETIPTIRDRPRVRVERGPRSPVQLLTSLWHHVRSYGPFENLCRRSILERAILRSCFRTHDSTTDLTVVHSGVLGQERVGAWDNRRRNMCRPSAAQLARRLS